MGFARAVAILPNKRVGVPGRRPFSFALARHRPAAEKIHMPKMVKKSDLPTKVCAACGLPFAWRKKWARDWDQVKYCSDRCRSGKS